VGLYDSTQFKNGSEIEKLVKPEVPIFKDDHMAHDKRVWERRRGELMKTVRELERNLCNLLMVLMSLSDSDTKTQVESTNEYPYLGNKWTLWVN